MFFKVFQDLSKSLQRCFPTSKIVSKHLRDAPKSSQDRSKRPQDPSRRPTKTPKRSLPAPKTRPRSSKRLPSGSKRLPRHSFGASGLDFGASRDRFDAPGNDFQVLQASNSPSRQASQPPIGLGGIREAYTNLYSIVDIVDFISSCY